MMDDDWDLHAVVRGCTAAVAAKTVSNNQHSPSNLPNHDHPNSFDFSGLEIYQELCVDDPAPTIAASGDISATSINPVPPPQPHQHVIPPLGLNLQIQENAHFYISPTLASPPQNFPASIPQPIRQRRRKKQQVKMVRQMTQEEISADSWAWRKYGQKPIKGSPHPRNYYRCSTSKGCAARKQVERSPNDPEIFVVSYSGEHTHPRPAHRSSLSGSTRSKLTSPPAKSRGGGMNAVLSQKGSMGSSSSPAAGSSFSPATPSMEGEAAAENDDVHMAEEGDGDDNENVIMIPNDLKNGDDDMFRAFQDYDDHSSGGGSGDFFSSALLLSSPPWTPTSPAGNADGGGG